MSAALAIREELIEAMPTLLASVPHTAKIIAFKAGVTPRCIEAIREREHGVSAHVLLALAKQYPAVKKLVLRLIDAETGDDPETPAQLIERIRKMVSA